MPFLPQIEQRSIHIKVAGKLKDIGAGIVGAFLIGATLLTPFLRPWRNKWGATDVEATRHLPGDDLVPGATTYTTRAITIYASADQVWRFLAQRLGAGLRVKMENKAKLQKPEEAL
jgi:hypothetical protein